MVFGQMAQSAKAFSKKRNGFRTRKQTKKIIDISKIWTAPKKLNKMETHEGSKNHKVWNYNYWDSNQFRCIIKVDSHQLQNQD